MESLDLQRHLISFMVDVFRLTVWLLILLVVFVPLERLAAAHPQKAFRKFFAGDLAYYLINGLVPKVLLAVPTAFLAWALHSVVPEEWHRWVEDLPLWARLAASVVVGEVGFYWGHRWAHEIPLLWRFHAVHHSAEEIDWLVNTRAHPVDIAFIRLCGLVPVYVLGLAQPLAGRPVDTVPLLLMLVATMWGFFIHANLRWRLGWLSFVIATPGFHHWHHTRNDHVNKNYASMLPFMDKLFGTWHLPKEWPSHYGTDTPVGSTLGAQLVAPLMAGAAAASEEAPIGAPSLD